MMNDINHTHRKKPKLALAISKSHDNFFDTLNPFPENQIIITNGITSPPPFYTKRPNKFRLTRHILFAKRPPVSLPTINYRTSIPFKQEEIPTLPNYSTTNAIQHDNCQNQHDNLTSRHDN